MEIAVFIPIPGKSIVQLHFDFSPSSCTSPPKCALRSLRLAVLLPFPPTPEVLRQHPAAQRLVIDHNPIFISQVLGG